MKTADAVLDAATKEQRQGNLTGARDLLEVATRTHAEDVRIWVRLGGVVRRLRQYRESVRVLRHAVELAPRDVSALVEFVEALRLDYRVDEALEVSLHLMDVAPADPSAQHVHAMALIESDQPNKALPLLNRLTTELPQKGEFWVALARALVKMGRFSEADRIAHRVTEDAPKYTVAYSVLAAANYGLRRDAAWMEAALKAYELDPSGPVPLLWMARIGERSGDAQREAAYLLAALKVQPRLVEARVMFGSHYWRADDLDAAEQAFLEALSVSPLDGMAQGMMAQFYVATGRGETDLDTLEMDAARRPYSRLAFYLGRIFLASVRDYGRAIKLLEIAAAHATESVETMELLGQAYLFDRRWQNGLDVLKRLVDLCPSAGEAWRGIGVAAQNLSDAETADAALKNAVTLLPDSAQAHFDRGLFLASQRREEGIAELRRAVAIDPNGQRLYVLAEALEEAGRLGEALEIARQAKHALPATDPDIDGLLARIEAAVQQHRIY